MSLEKIRMKPNIYDYKLIKYLGKQQQHKALGRLDLMEFNHPEYLFLRKKQTKISNVNLRYENTICYEGDYE